MITRQLPALTIVSAHCTGVMADRYTGMVLIPAVFRRYERRHNIFKCALVQWRNLSSQKLKTAKLLSKL